MTNVAPVDCTAAPIRIRPAQANKAATRFSRARVIDAGRNITAGGIV